MAEFPSTPRRQGVKRGRGSPTNLTPRVPSKRVSQASRCLFTPDEREPEIQKQKWSIDEVKAMVEFITSEDLTGRPTLMGGGRSNFGASDVTDWPTHKRVRFWSRAAKYIQEKAEMQHLRSGKLTVTNEIKNYKLNASQLMLAATKLLVGS